MTPPVFGIAPACTAEVQRSEYSSYGSEPRTVLNVTAGQVQLTCVPTVLKADMFDGQAPFTKVDATQTWLAEHTPDAQSAPVLQLLAFAHFGQELPPQSTSLSSPFFARSVQVGAAMQVFVAASQLLLWQSELAAQPWPFGQAGQWPPPQSTPVSAPSCTRSVQSETQVLPAAQRKPAPQSLLHEPQWDGEARSASQPFDGSPSQSAKPGMHAPVMHEPPEHVPVAFAYCEHDVPSAFCGCTQVPVGGSQVPASWQASGPQVTCTSRSCAPWQGPVKTFPLAPIEQPFWPRHRPDTTETEPGSLHPPVANAPQVPVGPP